MSDVNENKFAKVKLIKHFIKDLSFENPQDINDNNAENNNSNNLDINMNVFHQTYKDNFFSLILKYSFDFLMFRALYIQNYLPCILYSNSYPQYEIFFDFCI